MAVDTEDARESLRLVFEDQADWRRRKASEFPDDSRNLEAAELFDRLATTTKDIDPLVLNAYEELFEDIQESELQSELLREVGFQWAPSSAAEFVSRFIKETTGG